MSNQNKKCIYKSNSCSEIKNCNLMEQNQYISPRKELTKLIRNYIKEFYNYKNVCPMPSCNKKI